MDTLPNFPFCAPIGTQIVETLWLSTVETADPAAGYAGDADDGMIANLVLAGQANAAAGRRGYSAAPYTIRLRPLTDLQAIYDASRAFIMAYGIRAIDATLTGSESQDEATLTAIAESVTGSTNDKYAQSQFRFAEIGGWQPSYCRPSIVVNKREILLGFGSTAFRDSNRGDLSIGVMLPHCREFPFPIPVNDETGKVTSIVCSAQAGQYIEASAKIQRYPVLMNVTFVIL